MSNYDDKLQLLINKVEGLSDASWKDLCDTIGLDVHPDSLRKAFYNTEYSGYYVAKHLMNKSAQELTDEMMLKLQDKKDEEYKERIRLQDARREYNKELRAEARYENLVEVLEKELQNIDFEIKPFESKLSDNHSTSGKSAVLMLSDWHYGALCDSQWNYYDTHVAEQRAQELIQKTQKYILDFGIKDLTVEINGDMVEGLISISGRVASEESVVEQIVNVSKLLARCINSLQPYVSSMQVVTTLGNHGRLVSDKKMQGFERENFEMLIPEFLRLSIDKDIPIITSQGMDFVKYKCGDKTICLAHGHHDKANNAIEHMAKVYKEVPDEVHLGHYHHYIDTNESDIHVVVNGSLKGIDDYGLGATRSVTAPSQNLVVYGADRMIVEICVK